MVALHESIPLLDGLVQSSGDQPVHSSGLPSLSPLPDWFPSDRSWVSRHVHDPFGRVWYKSIFPLPAVLLLMQV